MIKTIPKVERAMSVLVMRKLKYPEQEMIGRRYLKVRPIVGFFICIEEGAHQ